MNGGYSENSFFKFSIYKTYLKEEIKKKNCSNDVL